MKIAITGANGFLGSYLVKEFLENNFTVIAMVRPSANTSQLPLDNRNLHVESVDYQQSLVDQLGQLKEKYGSVDLFLHNAGVTVSVDESEYFDINTNLTKNLAHAVKQTGWLASKFIYLSSLAAHGPKGVNRPVSIYGESKLRAEKAVLEASFKEHLIIRPTGIYGAGDYAFLPLFKAAHKGIYPMTRSSQKMSMIHAGDLARIIVKESGPTTGLLHVCDGETYTHQDFINSLEKAIHRKIRKLPIPIWATKASLALSDVWHKIRKKRPGLTREKFQEISQDWNLHENESLVFSKIPSQISLEEGFRDAYQFYKNKNLL